MALTDSSELEFENLAKFLNKYEELSKDKSLYNDNDYYFMNHFELHFANAILSDFSLPSARRVAKILAAMTEV